MRLVGFLFLILSSANSALASDNKAPLKVWLDMQGIEIQRAATLRYRNILQKTFARPIVYVSSDTHLADVRLMDRFTGEVENTWHTSNYLIDVIPSFSLVKKSDRLLPQVPLVGVIRRPYLTDFSGTRYMLDNMNTALTMLKNNRLDMILDYSREAGYYSEVDATTEIQKISEAKSVRVLFRSLEMTNQFNLAMSEIAGVQENIDNVIDSVEPFSNQNKDEKSFTWLMIAKQFDQQSNELVVTDMDIKISLWLETLLPEYRITTEQANITRAFEQISSRDNVCVVNIRKSSGREALANYSVPTYVFLDYRLYAMQGTRAQQDAEKWLREEPTALIRIGEFSGDFPTAIFGYYEYINRSPYYRESIEGAINRNQRQFVSIKSVDTDRSITLLQRNRLDFLISFPFVMQQTPALQFGNTLLVSYPIYPFNQPLVSHFACSKSKQGDHLIESINLLLANPGHRQSLRTLIVEDMLSPDKQAFIDAFDALFAKVLGDY